jgi:hypothetical protein
MDDLIDAINGYVFTLIALTLLTPMMVIHSLRAFLAKIPSDNPDES